MKNQGRLARGWVKADTHLLRFRTTSLSPIKVHSPQCNPMSEEGAMANRWTTACSGSHKRSGAKQGEESDLTNPTYHIHHILSNLMMIRVSELALKGQRSAICPQIMSETSQEGATRVRGRPRICWPGRGSWVRCHQSSPSGCITDPGQAPDRASSSLRVLPKEGKFPRVTSTSHKIFSGALISQLHSIWSRMMAKICGR